MPRHSHLIVALLTGTMAALLVGGCESTGLSVRERPGNDYANYALAALDRPSAGGRRAEPRPLPVKVAVAQLGEIAPPQKMLDALRADRDAFKDVEPVPAAATDSASAGWSIRSPSDPRLADQQQRARRQDADTLLRFARSVGCDYLVVFGGSLDHEVTTTPLAVFDLTIVGLFVVPSRNIRAEARAAATVIDVRTGQLVFNLNAQRNATRVTPCISRDDAELGLLTKMRDELTLDLAGQLKRQVRAVAGEKMAMHGG